MELPMTPPPEMPRSDPFQASLDSLTTAVESRPPIVVEEAPPTRGASHLYWLIGGLCVLTIGAAEMAILVRGDVATAPPVAAEVVAVYEQDPCARRVAGIMDAITAYARRHGRLPPTLAALAPEFLPQPPIDAVTQQPFGYEVIGDAVSLTCPSAVPAPPA
ncbi:MAG: hypothetical protein ACRERC_05440 [Candidatus Binatia bacterium]